MATQSREGIGDTVVSREPMVCHYCGGDSNSWAMVKTKDRKGVLTEWRACNRCLVKIDRMMTKKRIYDAKQRETRPTEGW